MNARSRRKLRGALERLMTGLICLDPFTMAYYIALVDPGTPGRDENHLIARALTDIEAAPPTVSLIEYPSAVRRLA